MDNCQCLWKRRSACRASIFGLLFTLGVVILEVELYSLLRMPHALLILLLLPFLETFLNCLANVYQLIPLLRIKESSSDFFFLNNKRKFGTLACFPNELKEHHVYCNMVLYRVMNLLHMNEKDYVMLKIYLMMPSSWIKKKFQLGFAIASLLIASLLMYIYIFFFCF